MKKSMKRHFAKLPKNLNKLWNSGNSKDTKIFELYAMRVSKASEQYFNNYKGMKIEDRLVLHHDF